ncbi:MAG: hypothetical protein ABIV48_01330, partial [Pyrinomonadaceae bacterium]
MTIKLMERNRSGNFNIARDLASQVAKNLLMGSSTIRKWRLKSPRTAVENSEIDIFLQNNAFNSLNFLLKYVGALGGKSICEIGAGDYLTSGVSILAAGAKKYCVIDRFPGNYSGETAKRWYFEIEKNWNRFYPSIVWNKEIASDGFPENSSDKLELIGESLETVQSDYR